MSLLKIEPENELIFRGPFKERVSVVMKLSNNGEKPVAFKIKVTELGFKYHVTPFQGVLGQKEAVPIQVTLMPFDPNVNRKQDKIKVLSVLAPEGDFKIKNLWEESTLEVHEWKLKCVLEIPDEGSSAATPAVSVNSSAKSQPEAEIECQVCVFKPSHQGPLVKATKSQVYFGGARIGQTQKQNVVVRNECNEQAFVLEVYINDSNDFFVSDENRSVSRRNFQLEPRQECSLELVFQPHNLGPLTAKLYLYPRCESAKNAVKYTVNLFGYGGSSHIQQLAHNTNGPEQTLVPKSKGTFWNCQLVLENRGNVAGFAFIQPLQENGKIMETSQYIVMPQCCLVNAGDFKRIKIHIHPSKNGTSLKLRLVWGDEPLRARWIRCIANGTPIKPTSEIDWAISSMLLQLKCNEDNNSSSPDISEEDMALFFNKTKVEEISVVIPEQGQKCQS